MSRLEVKGEEMLGPRSLCPALRLHLSHLEKVRLLGAFMEEGVGGQAVASFPGAALGEAGQDAGGEELSGCL